MAERKIRQFGDPILRKKAKPVTSMTPRIIRLLEDMADTVRADEGRAAIAAPQVGILRQLVVIQREEEMIELINPEILEMDGEQTGFEACLSFPGYMGRVKRADYVKVRTMNREGEYWTLEGENFLARCLQHEIDHLHGILYLDHIQGNELYHSQTQEPANLLRAIQLSRSS